MGIAGDIRLPSQQNDRLNRDLQYYLRSASAPSANTVLIRSGLPLSTLAPAVGKVVHDASPSFKIRTPLEASDKAIAAGMDTQRFVLRLIGAFALFAVVLAAVGLHAVIAYAVSQRTREIGVRVALGAEARDVARLVVRQGLALGVAGVALGAGGAIAATRLLRTFLYRVGPGDPATVAVVGLLLIAVALLATYAPARRASRLDPVEALRAE